MEQLNSAPSENGGGSCALSFTTNNSEKVAGTFSGTLVVDNGNKLKVTDGRF